jgi:hypothetical protein
LRTAKLLTLLSIGKTIDSAPDALGGVPYIRNREIARKPVTAPSENWSSATGRSGVPISKCYTNRQVTCFPRAAACDGHMDD